MKILVTVLTVIALTGCSGQARKDYYTAVETSSIAQSNTQVARFQALQNLATAEDGDSSAAIAAVMAIAMMREDTVRPQYVQDEALSYVQALAAPLTGVAALLIQADLSNKTNKQNNQTARAQIDANSAEQQALFGAFAAANDDSSNVTTDLAIGGIIDISTTALGTVETLVIENNGLIEDLSNTLQPIVPVEIVPVEIVPIEIVPIANPNQAVLLP